MKLRFSLRDLFWLVVVVAMALGWWLQVHRLNRLLSVSPPEFDAEKKVRDVMYGLWYERITPDEARSKLKSWGASNPEIDAMITFATRPPE